VQFSCALVVHFSIADDKNAFSFNKGWLNFSGPGGSILVDFLHP
jgi:hypothetical protein